MDLWICGAFLCALVAAWTGLILIRSCIGTKYFRTPSEVLVSSVASFCDRN